MEERGHSIGDPVNETRASLLGLDDESDEHDAKTEGYYHEVLRPCIAELFGCVIFVFIGCLSANSGGGVLAVGLAHGLSIFLLVVTLGHVSGGHFNPAVTLGIALAGGIKPLLALAYVLSQLVGGIIGAACVKGALNNATYTGIHGGANMLNESTSTVGMGILCEVLATCLLVSVVLGAAIDSKGQNVLAPLAIGVTVAVDIISIGPISGASMNPARSLGPALIAGIDQPEAWTYHYINWVGPFVGSLVAVLFYRLIFASWDKPLKQRLFIERDRRNSGSSNAF